MLKKIQNIIQKSYILIVCIAIFMIILLINIDHIFNSEILINVLLIPINLIAIFIINKLFINKAKDSNLLKAIIVLMILFVILEIFSLYFFRVKYNWDFKWVMDSAKERATTGTTQNMYYFKIFPNNWGALIITTLGMRMAFGNEIGAYVLNIIFIFLSVIFSVLSAKKIGGNKLALNLMIFIIGCAPLYLYSPIVYTDSLSVAFPIATFYFWLLAKENREKSRKKYIFNTLMMAIFGAIGYCIKPVAGIILVAILIDEIFSNTNKKTIKQMGITIITFMIIVILFNRLCEEFLIEDTKKNDLEFPMTHWIMMGLSTPESEGGTSIGYGAYSQKDADYTTLSGNYEEKKKANIEKIKERLKEFGIGGYIRFLIKKFDYVWNDGSYYSLRLIGWDTINTKSIPYKLIVDKNHNKIFKIYMNNYNNVLFFIILVGLVLSLLKKDINQEERVLGISIVGIAIFLLIWEARSRYIYFMLPIFCLLSAYEFIKIYNYAENKLKEKNKGKIKLLNE